MANYPASQPGSQRHTLSVLVENRPGVLARIAGLFARRAFNINSLSVSPTERPDISRVTVTAEVEEVPLEQIIKQLNKLLHVLKIVDLDPETTVERELVLIKVAADESNRSDVLGGSTLGSIANTQVSMNTVDIGLAQLAMHSAYETAGVKDVDFMIRALRAFYETQISVAGDGAFTLQ